ncbi:class I SAM-dependent methyltransferase [Sphingomonas immobilis]|uniref:Methyltransferase domain-containing protein n=1 Tax=Sphingomonas immobilis TaxID=3063997 RepID=A0ABT9A1K7_9SPHN|nr:methyltransferase domain-containing protein [Sphingomonas sp. CA1-15]MDO7843703.1 methyltransferase domain-containing protein [Sphingomonas sp. CA1-15]
MPVDVARDEFGARQAEMTARWYENVKASHGDVDKYIATRHEAYLDRWKEAGRFIADGSRVLDVGGGNLYPKLLEYFKDRGFRYHYLDVDPACVDGSAALAEAADLAESSFQHGYNDALPFDNDAFSALFSSHCLEHSIDLTSTFAEVNRVLAADGNLLMAVPFGWEANPEHPYFFGPDEWLSLVTDAGFQIRVAQIGREYPENGHDYFIAAKKISSPGVSRLNPADYTKESFKLIPHDDPTIYYQGDALVRDDHVIMDGSTWRIDIDVPAGTREVLPIFNRHDWSGIVEAQWGDQVIVEDLYSWFAYVQPVRLTMPGSGQSGRVTLSSHGANPSSHAAQGVLYGVMVR